MKIQWTPAALPRGRHHQMAACLSSTHVAVALEHSGAVHWFIIDLNNPAQPTAALALDARNAVLLEAWDEPVLLTEQGAVHDWPVGRRKAVCPSLAFGSSIAGRPLVAGSGGSVAIVLPDDQRCLRVWQGQMHGELTHEIGVRNIELGGGAAPTAILMGGAAERIVVVTAGERFDIVEGDGERVSVAHTPSGHPLAGAMHPTSPLVAILSRHVEIFDLSTRQRIDTLYLGNGSKLAGVFSADGSSLLLASSSALWHYDVDTKECVALGELPGSPAAGELPSIAMAAGDRVVLARDGYLFWASLPDLVGAHERPIAGRLCAWLEGAEHGEAHVQARFGSASVVMEPARGLEGELAGPAGGTTCPSCGSLLTGKKFSPLAFENVKKKQKGPHRLLPAEETRAAAEYDESAFLTFQLTELFRGARGVHRLKRWLMALGCMSATDSVMECYAWPKIVAPGAAQQGVARPSLLVLTSEGLSAFIFLPLRRHAVSKAPGLRMAACAKAVEAAAAAMGRSGTLWIVAADDHPALVGEQPNVLPWSRVVQALVHDDEADSRAARVTDRWTAALSDGTIPSPPDAWTDVMESRTSKFDYGTPVFPFRNQFTLSGGKTQVCHACGLTLGGGDGKAKRRDENPSWLDLVAEVAEDKALASEWLRQANLSIGEVERILFWPRLVTRATTPDSVFVGAEEVVVIEAKRPRIVLKADAQTAREILVRVANAYFLARSAGNGRLPRVVVVGRTDDPGSVRQDMAAQVWSAFLNDGKRVRTWSRSASRSEIFAESHDVAKVIAETGAPGLSNVITVCTYEQLAHALAQAASKFEKRCATTDPQAATAYRGSQLRAEGFSSLR